jgi:hypothetical protein
MMIFFCQEYVIKALLYASSASQIRDLNQSHAPANLANRGCHRFLLIEAISFAVEERFINDRQLPPLKHASLLLSNTFMALMGLRMKKELSTMPSTPDEISTTLLSLLASS